MRVNKFTRKYLLPVLLAGLFLGIGVDPEQEIIKAFISVIEEYSTSLAITLRIIVSIAAIYTAIRLWPAIFSSYRYIGLITASLVFIGIILLVADIPTGIWLLIIGFIIGILLP